MKVSFSSDHHIVSPPNLLGLSLFFVLATFTLPGAAQRAQAQEGFNTWAAYRARWHAIRTASIFTTETVHMLRTPTDPLDAPRTIYIEGKIDRPNHRSKANLIDDFGSMKYVMQMKTSETTSYTLQRSLMIVRNQWVPFHRDMATSGTETPSSILLDMLLLPDPDGNWKRIGAPEDSTMVVEGLTLPATFVTYHNESDTMAVTLSVDGRAIHQVRIFDRSGRLQSIARVRAYAREEPIGYIPLEVDFRQFDAHGQAYRDLVGFVVAAFNEPRFDYLFE